MRPPQGPALESQWSPLYASTSSLPLEGRHGVVHAASEKVKPLYFHVEQWDRVDLLQIFPSLFTFWCFLVFVGPVVKTCYLADDPSVSYSFGYYHPRLTILLPILFCSFGHILHRIRMQPDKWAVLVSLIGSSMVLWIFCNGVLQDTYHKANSYAASDCEVYTEKYGLEGSWLAAQNFSASCLTGNNTSGRHLITDCPGYDEELAKNPGWAYLQRCESEYTCSGWCESRESLWSLRDHQDPCSAVVSQILSTKVKHLAQQVTAYSMLTAITTAVFIILIGPAFRQRGFVW